VTENAVGVDDTIANETVRIRDKDVEDVLCKTCYANRSWLSSPRFAYLTGWRKGEIISLKWTDVDRDAGAIRLRPEQSKTGRGRTAMLER